MKQIILAVIVFFTLKITAQNTAYIYQNDILKVLPNYIDNVKQIDSLKTVYKNEIELLQKGISGKFQSLLTPYNIKKTETLDLVKQRMSAIDTTKLMLLTNENNAIQKKLENYNQLVGVMYKSDVQPLLDDLNVKINKYAKKHKIDVIYIMEVAGTNFAYINKKKNVTKDIIKILKK